MTALCGAQHSQSIIGILDRLGPKKIVIVSSSPQVRYPDYYGIDMAKMSEFIAFKAAVELLKDRDMKDVIAAAYRKSKVEIVYQPLSGLHEACPNHSGDWYFSGDYPTPGGVKLLNEAFINYIEQVYQF